MVGDIGDALLWLLNKCLLPLAKWGLESGLPAVFDLIAAALTALHSVLMAAEPTFDWMWNDFFQPIGQWTGELIIGALQKLTQALLRFSDWASQHKSTIQALTEVVIMFFAAWAVTTLVSHVGLMIANLGKLIGVLATTNIKFLAIVTVLTAVAGLAMKVAQAWTKMTPVRAAGDEDHRGSWCDCIGGSGDRSVDFQLRDAWRSDGGCVNCWIGNF
ncbi:MAG: hypothetical protein ACLR8P_14000 [Clostridium fessum]